MDTDQAWEQWGQRDPYYGVLTWEKFRSGRITTQDLQEFFRTGDSHLHFLWHLRQQVFGLTDLPARVLDFGCGVGRLVVPFARQCEHVTGVDVSPSMLQEARRHCNALGLGNVVLVVSDDTLSRVTGEFDLVHSVITLQHIEPARVREILRHLIARLAPGGVAALQLTYGKAYHPDTFGQPPEPVLPTSLQPAAASLGRLLRRGNRPSVDDPAPPVPGADPPMLMFAHSLNEAAFIMQTGGVRRFHAEFTDHGGELGVYLFFQRETQGQSS